MTPTPVMKTQRSIQEIEDPLFLTKGFLRHLVICQEQGVLHLQDGSVKTWILDVGVIKVCLEVPEDPVSVGKLLKNKVLKNVTFSQF